MSETRGDFDCIRSSSFRKLKVDKTARKQTYKKGTTIAQPFYVDKRMNDDSDGDVFVAIFYSGSLERDFTVRLPGTNGYYKVEKRRDGYVYVIGPHKYHEECQCKSCENQR